MPISARRLQRDFDTIAGFTATPGHGASRPTFSPTWRAACDYVIAEARAAGCELRVDAAGNIHLRPESHRREDCVWLSGSHLDSVPHGGNFDGVLGVVAPLEVLRAAHDDGRDVPLELVIFAEEEGTTFGLGMLGSRAWVGTLDAAQLATVCNAPGQNYLEAGAPHGVVVDRLTAEQFRPADCLGLVELHIEQGAAMWKNCQPVAIVTAINGRRQYCVELHGMANHAGSTRMTDRRDALAGAAEAIAAIERLAPTLGGAAVATVGQIHCLPNATNVIPEHVTFSIDFRAPADKILETGSRQLEGLVREIAGRRNLQATCELVESLPAVAMDSGICNSLRRAAERLGHAPLPETTSGALHDSAILAPLLPTAMLFVASRDGISHNSAEFSRLEDMVLATEILAEVVR
ncbi:MAG TPA: M20 family metallo-hydrolase [Pirellulales bacterium]|jgi:allantoate deiminase|nr:M20 family metallo-hydrolase [Pirellulales bacterium]